MPIKVTEPSVQIISKPNGEEALKLIELAGRLCYHSQNKTTAESARAFVKARLAQGHESIIEHYAFTARFICDRGIANEIVRHRLASYNQSSTRYISYTDPKHVGELSFIQPPGLSSNQIETWRNACEYAARSYSALIADGVSPQMARSVLPLCLRCELVMTANLREWRHFLKLRTSPAAHPQIRALASDLLKQCKETFPVIFDDIKEGA